MMGTAALRDHVAARAVGARLLVAVVLVVLGLVGSASASASLGHNGRIFFEAWGNGNGATIFSTNLNGELRSTGLTELGNEDGLAVSPDGKYLAYTGLSPFPGSSPDGIHIRAIDGSSDVQISNNTPQSLCIVFLICLPDVQPTWSPDASKLAFFRYSDAVGGELWIVNRDGSDEHIINVDSGINEPDWSPDGSLIAFDARGGIRYWSVAARRATIVRQDGDDSAPRFSPDGQRVLFNRGSGNAETIWVMRTNGTDGHQLATGDESAWSPDERFIVFSRGSDLWVMNANGSDPHLILPSTNQSVFSEPDWQRLP
jgi:Tol biopolymer transport system component